MAIEALLGRAKTGINKVAEIFSVPDPLKNDEDFLRDLKATHEALYPTKGPGLSHETADSNARHLSDAVRYYGDRLDQGYTYIRPEHVLQEFIQSETRKSSE